MPVTTAHPVQLTFAAACADVYHQEDEVKEGVARRGVAYLIRENRAVTAYQVVQDRLLGQPVWLRFSGGLRAASLLAWDEEADCALLELLPAMVSQLALTLARGLSQPGDACQTLATPTLRENGQVIQALVKEPLGEDALRGPALLLQIVAGHERPMGNFAGSPILHDGFVVGHLRAVTRRGGETELLCCPSPYIDALDQSVRNLAPGQSIPPVALRPQPPKAGYNSAWYVPRLVEETQALEHLTLPAQPLLIFAPEGHGKTWFLHRLLSEVRMRGDVGVHINLERLPVASRSSLEAFLTELGRKLSQEIQSEFHAAAEGWGNAPLSALPVPALMEEAMRAVAPRCLYLALDQFDILRETMFQDAFLGLFTDWAESGATPGLWAGLRLVLFSATAPDWLLRPQSARPCPIVTQELLDLSKAQLLTLSRYHDLDPGDKELTALQALVGGHPFLCRVALYSAAVRKETLGEVLRSRVAMPTVFDPFLEACQRRVAAQPGLWPTLARLLRGQPLEALDRLLLPRLERMGIVKRAPSSAAQPVYALRYPLYRRLLDL